MSWLMWAGGWLLGHIGRLLGHIGRLFANLWFFTGWCLGWAVYDYIAQTGWLRWVVVGYWMAIWTLFFWLGRRQKRRRVWVPLHVDDTRQLFITMLTDSGIPLPTAEWINQLMEEDRVGEAAAILAKFREAHR